MEIRKLLKVHAIDFAEWVHDNCNQGIKGYFLVEPLTEFDSTEFQLDELYDLYVSELKTQS